MILYHRTNHKAAQEITETGRFTSKEAREPVYFSNRKNGQATGYGLCVVTVDFPDRAPLELDDEFPDGEQHFTIRAHWIQPEWIKGHTCG